MRPLCCWKQWAAIAFTTLILMFARIAIGETPKGNDDEAELRELMQQMEAYQNVAVESADAGPRHPTPRERSLEAELAVMHDRAVAAEGALKTCKTELESLKEQ